MDCSPNNPWATGARDQQMAKCVISWEGTQQAHLYINRRHGSQQGELGDRARANETAHTPLKMCRLSAALDGLKVLTAAWQMHPAPEIASECMMTTRKWICAKPTTTSRRRGRKREGWTTHVIIPEVAVPDPDLWPHTKPADFRTSTTLI